MAEGEEEKKKENWKEKKNRKNNLKVVLMELQIHRITNRLIFLSHLVPVWLAAVSPPPYTHSESVLHSIRNPASLRLLLITAIAAVDIAYLFVFLCYFH